MLTYDNMTLEIRSSNKKDKKNNSKMKEPKTYNFEQTLINRKDLVSIEDDNKKNVKKKKEIISYISNRDTLYIPVPEKTKRPVEINEKLIEEPINVPITHIGIQSDQINYINKEKPYVPQKIGKDVGVQIEDGDLFDFNRDVEPLLKVLTGKILEQTLLELEQEEEMKNIRNAKNIYIARMKKEKNDIKNIEEKENQKRTNFENLKKIKQLDKYSKITTQQKLMSRIFSIKYIESLKKNTISLLNPIFKDYKSVEVKDKFNKLIYDDIDKVILLHDSVWKSVSNYKIEILDKDKKLHSNIVSKRKEEAAKLKSDQERIKKEQEEKKRIEEEEKIVRRKNRALLRLKRDFNRDIFNIPVIKGEYLSVEISEIDNMNNEGPYVGIYGGLFGCFLITLEVMHKLYYKSDKYYTENNITDMITSFLNECSGLTLYFNKEIEDKITNSVPNITDINNIKTAGLSSDEWNILYDILKEVELNLDPYIKTINTNTQFYNIILKCLINLIEKNNEKVNIVFKEKNMIENYKALCLFNFPNDEVIEYNSKDKKKKKGIKPLEYTFDINAKLFSKTQDANVLIYNKKAEFIIRNKVLEIFMRSIEIIYDEELDIDLKKIYTEFGKAYDDIIISTGIYEKYTIVDFYDKSEIQDNQ